MTTICINVCKLCKYILNIYIELHIIKGINLAVEKRSHDGPKKILEEQIRNDMSELHLFEDLTRD